MKSLSDQVVYLAAVGVLVAGGACAGRLYLSPTRYTGPNTRKILAASQRLDAEFPKAPVAETASAVTRVASAPASKSRKPIDREGSLPIVTIREVTAPKKPTPTPVPKRDLAPATRMPSTPPGSHLALTGIAGWVNDREAMFFNLSDGERASGKQGDSVFGFTIAAVHDDAVDLKQGLAEVTLRMGEKSAAVRAALARSNANTETVASGFPLVGAGPLGSRVSASDVRGPDARTSLPSSTVQSTSLVSRGDDGRNRRGASTTRSGARRYSDVASSSRRYSRVHSYASNRYRRFDAFGVSGFGGRRWGGRGYRPVLEPTPNPQAARRTGAALTGDTEAITEPEALSNPQTQRRMGAARGQTFGAYGYDNRGGNIRGGAFGGDRFHNSGRTSGGRTSGSRTGSPRG